MGFLPVRVARAATLDFVTSEFVLAARARGERKRTIVMSELLPNVRDVLLVDGSMNWSWMLLGFTSLSFLGFGVVHPHSRLGFHDCEKSRDSRYPALGSIWTSVMLSTLIIGINLFSDAFAKALGLDRSQGAPV